MAEAVFGAAVMIDPRHQASQFALARLLLQRRDLPRASIHLRNTVEIDANTAQGKAAAEMLRRLAGS